MADDDATPEFEQLLGYLRDSRGFDFTGYKRPSLRRRIDKQMRAAGVAGYSEYVDLLEVHPAEFSTLFNSILINVTAFFRDPAAWTYLLEVLLPRRLAEIGPTGRSAYGVPAVRRAKSLARLRCCLPSCSGRRVRASGEDLRDRHRR